MSRHLTTWKLIDRSLKRDIGIVLLYVVDSKGSSPGRRGFMMAVNAYHEIAGSIGGGIMEHKFVEWSKNILKNNSEALFLRQQIHDKSVSDHQSGMICSGEQTIFIYLLKKTDAPAIENIINVQENAGTGFLHLSYKGIFFSGTSPTHKNFNLHYEEASRWSYIERIGIGCNIYIVGGGHCAMALSKVIALLDFTIHIFDNRSNLNTYYDNNWVHSKTIIENYSQLHQYIPEGDNNYVVLMTQGYRTDDEALRALWNKKLKYMGILGSQHKINKMLEEYRKEGVDENLLSTLHAPVGIPIFSRTPEEIAISIAAEIIRIRNTPNLQSDCTV